MNDALDAGREHSQVQDVLAKAFVSSPVPLFLVEDHQSILDVSEGACRLLGLDPGDLVGSDLGSVFNPSVDFPALAADAGLSARGELRLEVCNSSGECVPVRVTCQSPDCAAGGGICLISLYDLSGRQTAAIEHNIRLSRLSLLNQVSGILHRPHLALAQILRAVLIGVTAGEGLGFNRAFLLLIDEERKYLQGEVAIGPSDQAEAGRIWHDLDSQELDLEEMMISYDRSLDQTDPVVNQIVQDMRISMEEEHVLVDVLHRRKPLLIGADDSDRPGVSDLQTWLRGEVFAVAPLTTRRGVVGVIVADNAITRGEISDLDIEFLQLLANQSASAIENNRLYFELERRLVDLRQAVQRNKEAQEMMLQMERLSIMGETSAIVAHELRNPLVAIGGFGRTLERNLDESDPNHRFARIITEEVARLERIIHDLLDFIRPQRILRKLVDAEFLVTESVSRYGEEISARGISLILNQNAGDMKVNVNPGEIKQVIDNIIMNAVQMLDDKGVIEIETNRIEGGFKVEIADNGPGLDPEAMDKAFSPFFTTKTSGSGLGLTISTQIIKAHGGVLKVANRESGGAVFTVILPLPKEENPRNSGSGAAE